jgi:hypothetical protein
MTSILKTLTLLLIFEGIFIMTLSAQDYPPIQPIDTSGFGKQIQRTMHKLAESTPEKRNKVRILFYGQSVVGQRWSDQVERYLREKFPNADLEVENRAIGGFAAQLLIRPAVHDLYPYYPDLMIFHVYGSHIKYEEIIANVRKYTTAEIAITNDHFNRYPKIPEKTPVGPNGKYWDYFMNDEFLPGIAEKYDCEFIDVRNPWKQYLEDNGYEPSALLKDGVHLNEHGKWLMAELVWDYLRVIPDAPTDKGMIRDIKVGDDVKWQDGKLRVEVTGNRMDIIPAAADGQTAAVTVDGKKPSELIGAWALTRPKNVGNLSWPWAGLKRVMFQSIPVAETWTLKTLSVDETGKDVTFEVVGSVTGPDGKGNSHEVFVSDSGRVVIAPEDWHLEKNINYTGDPAPEGYSMTWDARPQHLDTYASPEEFDPAREQAVTVAQGLSNMTHVLTLTAVDPNNPPDIRAIRIFEPPLKDSATGSNSKPSPGEGIYYGDPND